MVLDVVKAPDVVEAVEVVGMRVGKENGVEVLYSGIQHLHPEVRRGVDDNGGAAAFYRDAGPAACIVRVTAPADCAVAADYRDAL